jgi:hypothetical protein
MEGILSGLRLHDAATAYRDNLSIANNAAAHVQNGPILKYDFKDFFPSLSAADWRAYCHKHALFDDENDIYLTSKIFFHSPRKGSPLRLAIGAPSSPLLSNILMYDFDKRITELLAPQKIIYTRYADDMTFSAKRTGYLNAVDKTLRRVLREQTSPNLRLNEEKTVLATKKYKRCVTGLVLSNEGKVSLGHERKKKIRAAIHHYINNKIENEKLSHLRGLIAFAISVEPDFVERLRNKFGSECIDRLLGRTVSLQ